MFGIQCMSYRRFQQTKESLSSSTSNSAPSEILRQNLDVGFKYEMRNEEYRRASSASSQRILTPAQIQLPEKMIISASSQGVTQWNKFSCLTILGIFKITVEGFTRSFSVANKD